MKAFVALAAAAIATLSSGHVTAREVRTTFSFVVVIDDRVWSYNDNVAEDINVLMPMGSPWRCVRQRLTLPGDGMAKGSIECSADAGKTSIVVSAACGLDREDHHNSAVITAGKSQVILNANCNTSVYENPVWPGF
jgi:hypothetical protein